MPISLSIRSFNNWLKALPISEAQRTVLTTNIAMAEAWWGRQPAEAFEPVQRVAVMMGIPIGMLKKNFDATNLIKVLTAAISMTNWLAPQLRKKLKHKMLNPICKLLIRWVWSSISSHPSPWLPRFLFFKAFASSKRMMVLSVIHGLLPNQKLRAILEGCANLNHLWDLGPKSFCTSIFPSSASTFVSRASWTCNPNSILGLQCTILWTASTVAPESFSNWPMTACPCWIGSSLLEGAQQFVHLGSNSTFCWKGRLSMPWTCSHPGMATSTQLPVYMPIFPSQKRHSQKTCDEQQCTVWPCHSLASCQTQVHPTGSQGHLGIRSVPKQIGTLDHHPVFGIKHQSQIRTNQNASFQWGWSYPMLYIASTGKQHPGAIPHTLSPGHRRVYTMVAGQTSPTCLSTTGAMVSEPQSPKNTQAIFSASGTFKFWLTKSHATHLLSRQFSSSTPQCLANYATTSMPSPNGPPIPVLNAAANDGLSTKRQPSTPLTPIGSYQVPFLQACFLQICDLSVIAEGYLLKKVFPSKKEYHATLRFGLHQWTKCNGLPSMIHCSLPTSVRRSCLPLWRQTSLLSPDLLPVPLFSGDRSHLHGYLNLWDHDPRASRHCQFVGLIASSTIWQVIPLGHWQRPPAPSWLHLGQKESVPKCSKVADPSFLLWIRHSVRCPTSWPD